MADANRINPNLEPGEIPADMMDDGYQADDSGDDSDNG